MVARAISFRTEGSPLLGRLGLLNPGIRLRPEPDRADDDHGQPVRPPVGPRAVDDPVPRGVVPPRADHAGLYRPVARSRSPAWSSIVYDPSSSSGQLIGVALTLGGIVCCAVYSVVDQAVDPGGKETSQVILAQQGHALALALVAGRHRRRRRWPGRADGADAARARQRDRIGSPLLRGRLLVLPRRPAPRASLDRGAVVLPDPDRRSRRRSPAAGRAPRPAAVGRRGASSSWRSSRSFGSQAPHPWSRRPRRFRSRRISVPRPRHRPTRTRVGRRSGSAPPRPRS